MPFSLITGAIVGGTALAIAGAKQQSETEQALADYDAQVADREAALRKDVGKIAVEEQREDTQRLLSSQRAAFGKAGVGGVSPALVALETAERGELDALRTQFNVEAGVERARSQADISRLKGKSAARAGTLRQGQALFGGLTQLGMAGGALFRNQ